MISNSLVSFTFFYSIIFLHGLQNTLRHLVILSLHYTAAAECDPNCQDTLGNSYCSESTFITNTSSTALIYVLYVYIILL